MKNFSYHLKNAPNLTKGGFIDIYEDLLKDKQEIYKNIFIIDTRKDNPSYGIDQPFKGNQELFFFKDFFYNANIYLDGALSLEQKWEGFSNDSVPRGILLDLILIKSENKNSEYLSRKIDENLKRLNANGYLFLEKVKNGVLEDLLTRTKEEPHEVYQIRSGNLIVFFKKPAIERALENAEIKE